MIAVITTDDGRTFVTTENKVDAVIAEIELSSVHPVEVEVDRGHDYMEIVPSGVDWDPQMLDI